MHGPTLRILSKGKQTTAKQNKTKQPTLIGRVSDPLCMLTQAAKYSTEIGLYLLLLYEF